MRPAMWLLIAYSLVAGPLAVMMGIGVLDIVASIADNHIGILTGRAVRAVAATEVGDATVARILERRFSNVAWAAEHADDDSLSSVRVTAIGNTPAGDSVSFQWCVFLTSAWSPTPSFRVREIAPANREAWSLDPRLASTYRELD